MKVWNVMIGRFKQGIKELDDAMNLWLVQMLHRWWLVSLNVAQMVIG